MAEFAKWQWVRGVIHRFDVDQHTFGTPLNVNNSRRWLHLSSACYPGLRGIRLNDTIPGLDRLGNSVAWCVSDEVQFIRLKIVSFFKFFRRLSS